MFDQNLSIWEESNYVQGFANHAPNSFECYHHEQEIREKTKVEV